LVFQAWESEKSYDLSKNTTPASPISTAIDMTIVRLNGREIEKKEEKMMQISCLLYLIHEKHLSHNIKYEFSTERITLMKE
jgi:CRISPR/Cas system CSM-associated protein Csm4 (group 5 of RAMP superfamily)